MIRFKRVLIYEALILIITVFSILTFSCGDVEYNDVPVANNMKETAIASTSSIEDAGYDDNEQIVEQIGEPIRIILVGDINLDSKVAEVVETEGGGDYRFPFLKIADYLNQAHIVFGNLESLISDKGKKTKLWPWNVPFRADPRAVEGLTFAGFNVMSVANNHSGDYHYAAMEDNFNRLRDAGIEPVGGGRSQEEAHAPVIKEVNGTKIAFLAYNNVPMYSYLCFLGLYPASKWIAHEDRSGYPTGIAWMSVNRFERYGNLDDLEDDIIIAKEQADLVIISIHFGWEYKYQPDSSQKEIAHRAIDLGAALVVGHHPHVIQPVEVYNGFHIAYSLGNFIFDISEERAVGTTRGLALDVLIEGKEIISVDQTYIIINEYYQAELE